MMAPRAFAASAVAVVFALLFLVLRTLLVERPPLPVPLVQPPLPPLTRHLAFFLLDGLRYDYATDPDKAPNLARRMSTGTSGRVLAGQITMTSAAVLSFGTGARGDFAQVVTNLSMSRTRQNDLFANARARGLRTALVGDRTWLDAFGDEGFDEAHPDATGLALDVDNSPEMFEEADKLLLRAEPPNLTVVHFLATDHFGHAFGTTDPRYLDMLKRFDARLEETLSRLSPRLTVIILSDHGATATGAHGSDIWSVRQTPLLAFGPGIRNDARGLAFEQVDVAPTVATLLGVPVPTEARGTAATALLDLDVDQIGRIRRAECERAAGAARALTATWDGPRAPGTSCAGAADPGDAAVRGYDRRIAAENESLGLSAAVGTLALLFVGLAAAALAVGSVTGATRARSLRWGALLFSVAFCSVLLTKYVELVVPPFHNVIRGVLFVFGNAVLLAWALRRGRMERFAVDHPVVFYAVVPGAIAFSYPANTQPEAFVAAALLLLSALLARGERHAALVAVSLFVAIHRFGYVNEDPFPAFLAERAGMLVAVNLLGLGAWSFFTPLAREESAASRAAWAAFPFLALVAAAHVRPPVGIALTVAFPTLAVLAYVRGNRLGARNLTLATFLLLSRDVEVLPVLALAALAELSPAVLSPARGDPADEAPESLSKSVRLTRVAGLALVMFGLSFLARVAIQRGLDFDRMHFGAGAFGSPDPNKTWVAVMMGFRYALVAVLLHGVAVARIAPRDQTLVVFAWLVVWLGRAATLCTMLVIGRTSYWTAQRTISDVSPALIATLVLALLLATRRNGTSRGAADDPAHPLVASL